MYRRNITPNILDALTDTPVVFIRGARQVGKTTLVKMIAEASGNFSYVSLDHLGQLSIARNDPIGFIKGLSKPAIIDEIQRAPELVSYLQAAVDERGKNGLYVLTGSQQFHQPVAGRSDGAIAAAASLHRRGSPL